MGKGLHAGFGDPVERRIKLRQVDARKSDPSETGSPFLAGPGHMYQGPAGIVSSAVAGLYYGALYFVSDRNLWLAILAHGFSNTLAHAMIYLGLVPLG